MPKYFIHSEYIYYVDRSTFIGEEDTWLELNAGYVRKIAVSLVAGFRRQFDFQNVVGRNKTASGEWGQNTAQL